MKYIVNIIRPGGNDTALIEGLLNPEEKRIINDVVMRSSYNVEQVGFYNYDLPSKKASLEMAGGEFCGNALRSLAYLLLNGKKGELKFNVSGTNQILKAGIKCKNSAYAYMPIYADLNCVKQIEKGLFLVELEGISHLIISKPQRGSRNNLKTIAKNLLIKNNQKLSNLAAGVMFVDELSKNELTVDPIVWVRDIETFFYETACASGSTAIGLLRAKLNNKRITNLRIKQPSGQWISVVVRKTSKKFLNAVIDGPVKILEVKYD